MAHFAAITGDSGRVIGAASAVIGIFSQWNIKPSGIGADGHPALRFRGLFLSARGGWVNATLMKMNMRKGVFVQMRTASKGVQTIEILAWEEWKFDPINGELVLEGVKF